MCTTGYNKKLNIVFKNRDKNIPTQETIIIKPNFLAVKTEGSDYYGLGINRYGCAFVSAAVNTPVWTSLAAAGEVEEAAAQLKIENEGLSNPIRFVSQHLPYVKGVDEWLEKILNAGVKFMGYNLLLADREKALHIELYGADYHITQASESFGIANHFKQLNHGPENREDYPNSYNRYEKIIGMLDSFVSTEDLFKVLRMNGSEANGAFWREGAFSTVSSSILDLDAFTLYYTNAVDMEYSCVSGRKPLKENEKIFIEMSRYIDLPTYHKIERGHPFYEEMLEELDLEIKKFHKLSKSEKIRVLEFGSGTGIYTSELGKHSFVDLYALDYDDNCAEMLRKQCDGFCRKIIVDDAVTYYDTEKFDVVTCTFAHDHIHFNKRFALARNIHKNLRKGGRYLMGGEFLPYFSTETDRKKALFKYHNNIIDIALQHDRVQVCELENNALKSGLDMVGDFKRHEKMFEEEMISADFKMIHKKKLGPLDRDDLGGVFVYVFEAF